MNKKQLKDEVTAELITHLIPFWKSMRDTDYGGFYGLLDYDLHLDKKAEKGCICNSRILWFFSNTAAVVQDTELLDYAAHAFKFLKNNCLDTVNGGVFWSVNYDGSVKDSTKHTYNQAFAVYALSSYAEVSGNAEALSLAFDLFEMIESRMRDDIGYLEAFTEGFIPVRNEKLSENGVLAEKTMNTFLHVFESYSELYRVCRNMTLDARGSNIREQCRTRLLLMLHQFADKIWNPEKCRQEVFFDRELNSILDLHSYGHDIETSWLIDRGVEIIGDTSVESVINPITSALAAEIYKTAYRDHSLLNECDRGNVNTLRIWWVQAEAVLGFFNAAEKNSLRAAASEGKLSETLCSLSEKYLHAVYDIWDYIKKHIIDNREHSEWFWCADANGDPVHKPIAEPWKCPYHNGRMCMELIKNIR
jgi:mannobiose 2-epimerase